MNFIQTLSICPECYKRIPADIVIRDGAAWMTKTCDVHGDFEALVDPDASLIMQHYNTGTRGLNKAVLVPITPECNMSCSWCYTNGVKTKICKPEYYDRAMIDLKLQGFTFLASGGEPTIMPDFFDFISRMKQLGWPIVTMSNMLKFADIRFMEECATIGMVQNHVLHADFSMQHPKNYDGEIAAAKYGALCNLERLGIKANCIQFSIGSLDELQYIRKFYDDTKNLYNHIRIRTLFGFWKDESEKIYLSQLFNEFKQVFGDLMPVFTNDFESSNIYSLYMRDTNCGISLSSAPTVNNLDVLSARRPTLAMALDGKCYSLPVAQIISEGIEKGWYNGYKVEVPK